MIYILLIIIILLLVYIAFFTPEKRERRNIKRAQNLFNASLETSLKEKTKFFKRSFIESCEKKATNTSCVCMYNYIESTLGLESFYADSETLAQTGVFPKRLREATDEALIHCIK